MMTSWSDEQRIYLAAMGYTLYQRVAGASLAGDLPAQRAAAPAFAAPVPSGPDNDPPMALWLALLRAARLRPLQIEGAQDWLHAHQIPPLAHLRRDPAAKRASWPIVRAMRRPPP